MLTPIRLIVGLGNPGPKYQKTRHNAGAWFVEALAHHQSISLKPESKFHASIAKVREGDHECSLFIPSTYMNESGLAVRSFAHFYKIPAESILIAHDELDFEPGITRLKQGGGARWTQRAPKHPSMFKNQYLSPVKDRNRPPRP